jgi:NAD(P)-dependent dehydrogenase (short-subunit alcohol dehydrogenase family)
MFPGLYIRQVNRDERQAPDAAGEQERHRLRRWGRDRRGRGPRIRPRWGAGLPGRPVAGTGHRDVLDAASVEEHFGNVTARAGAVDVSFNAFGLPQRGVQGIPLAELTPDAFAAPVTAYATAFFVTATAAARHMAGRGSGAILTLTASPARLAAPLVGGMAPAWAAVEALTRDLAAEVGPRGVRVLGLRPDGIPGTPTLAEVYGLHAAARGTTPAEIRAFFDARTSLGRQPTLTEVAEVAAFLVSDRASGLTGTIVNLSCGSIVD